MPSVFSLPTPRSAAIGLLAAVAVILLPARAAAGCGDYVVVGGAQVAPRPADHVADDAPAPGLPCDGPACSGRPAGSALPPSGLAGETSCGPEWAVAASAVTPPDPGRRGRSAAGPAAHPDPISRAVFHPPRTYSPSR